MSIVYEVRGEGAIWLRLADYQYEPPAVERIERWLQGATHIFCFAYARVRLVRPGFGYVSVLTPSNTPQDASYYILRTNDYAIYWR